VELLAGDPAAAEREIRADCEMLQGIGETFFLSSMAAILARAVQEQGRDDEALALTEVAEKSAAADDAEAQAFWRSVRAVTLARRGALEEAEVLARAALDLIRQGKTPSVKASALVDLATVLFQAKRTDEARQVLSDAIAFYAAKGDLSSVARAKNFLATMP